MIRVLVIDPSLWSWAFMGFAAGFLLARLCSKDDPS